MITIFDKDWGSLVLELSWNKIDFLPRFTANGFEHAFIFVAGFLMININFTVWDKPMRNTIRKWRSDSENLSDNA